MVHVNNFTYGPVTPVLGFVMSSLGCFLGLRAATRARASHGARRVRWLLLATVSIATTGIWVMHFVAMLGFTIPGQAITYSVPVTILSMLIAVIVVGIGLLIVGFGSATWRTLLTGGVIIGFGVASMHYIGMAAMKMPDTVRYNYALVAASVLIAVVAGTAALWAALRLATVGATLVASLIMGVAVSGMHYTGMAAMHVYGTQNPGMLAGMSGGVSAASFLLPLIIGISLLAFVLTVIISLSPTEEEMREDAALMAHLSGRAPQPSLGGTHRAGGPPAGPPPGPPPGGPGQYGQREDPADPDAGRWFRPQSLALRGSFAEPAPRQLRWASASAGSLSQRRGSFTRPARRRAHGASFRGHGIPPVHIQA
jgi:NO-binding membrane sensor protein with MHYT domain